MLSTSIGRLRIIGMVEGASYLLLLFIAMPLKYVWGDPSWVRHIGMAHGVLFVGLCISIFEVMVKERWSIKQCLVPFVASLLPFGPFVIDGRLKAAQREREQTLEV